MRILIFVFALASLTSSPIRVYAAPGDVTVIMADMPISTVLEIYGLHAGAKVIASDEVKAMKVRVSINIRRRPKEEALKLIDEALAKQAGVEILREQDGSYSARRIVAKK